VPHEPTLGPIAMPSIAALYAGGRCGPAADRRWTPSSSSSSDAIAPGSSSST
jgi:hypothetical protein